MKILKMVTWGNNNKFVKYFDLILEVPNHVYYLAVDKSGMLYGYKNAYVGAYPFTGCWDNEGKHDLIGKVDLEGLDWMTTLKRIEEHEEVKSS